MNDRSYLDPFDRSRYDAILFDLDGVLTETATTHMKAWKVMFDEYLLRRSIDLGEGFTEFITEDYLQSVDGRPRFDGVRTFLSDRDIDLPEGSEDGPLDADTVRGLGMRKNAVFLDLINKDGAAVLPGTLRFVERALDRGMRTAVVSSSANAEHVLAAAGIGSLFEARIDGVVAEALGLAGKPDPESFLEAARRLNTLPARSVVIEDAVAGVEAGRSGGFGLVIGIGPPENALDLRSRGADVVVENLGALIPD